MTPGRILLILQLRILEILGKNLKTLEKYISLKYVIGCSNFKLKKFDNSLYCFNEIIKRKGEYSYPSVYVYKGILAQMKKDKDSACLCFSRAGELGDESAYKYINKC